MSTLSTAKFEFEIGRFKALFTGHDQLYRYGQFYVLNRTFDEMLASASSAMAPWPLASTTFMPFLEAALDVDVHSIDVAAIRAQLDAMEATGIAVAPIRAMLQPGAPDVANAQADYNKAWSTTNILPAPTLSPPTLRKYIAAYDLEKSKCFDTVRAFGAKLLKALGAPATIPVVKRISMGIVAGASVQSLPSGQQQIVYASPAALASAIEKIKDVVDPVDPADPRFVVQCGLLSGLKHEHSVFPTPEHYILIFAHDIIAANDAFLFWDPDANESNVGATTWGRGFGVLIAQGNRLSTAMNATDFTDLDSNGRHLAEQRRHRYQVYYLQSLPL